MSLMGDDNEFAGISGYLAREDEDDPEFVGISRFAPKEYETRSPFVEGLKGVVEGFTDPEETRRQRQAYWQGSDWKDSTSARVTRGVLRPLPVAGSISEAFFKDAVGEPQTGAGKVAGTVADVGRTIGEFVLPMAGASLATKAGAGGRVASAIANNPIKYAMGSQAIQEAKEGGFEDPLGAAANIGAAGVGAKLGNVAGARYGALGGGTASRVGKIAATEAGIEAVSGVPAAVVNSADLIAKAQSGGWDSLAPEEKSQLLAQVGASALASALGTTVGALSLRARPAVKIRGGDGVREISKDGGKTWEPIPQGAGTFPRGIFAEADAVSTPKPPDAEPVAQAAPAGAAAVETPDAQFAKKKPDTGTPTAQPRPPRIVDGDEYHPQYGDRIAIDKIPSSVAPSPDDALGALTAALDTRVFKDKMPKGTAGYYEPGTGKKASGGPRNFPVLTHELAHYMDDLVDFGQRTPGQLAPARNSPLWQEVVPEFARHGSTPPQGHPDPDTYLWHEGVAEFLMAWAFNPDQTRTLAPRMTRLFETKASAPIRQALRTYGDSIRRFMGAPKASRMAANVKKFYEYLDEKNDPRPTWQKFVEGLQDTMLDRNSVEYRTLRQILDAQGATQLEKEAAVRAYRSARQRLYGVSGEVDETWQSGLLLDPVDNPGARATEGGIGWLFEPLLSGGDLKRNYDDALAVGLSRELKDRFVDIHKTFDAALVRAQQRIAKYTAEFNALDPNPANVEAAKRRKVLAGKIFNLTNTAPAKINAQRRRAIESQFGGGLDILAEGGMPDAALRDVATDPERFARATEFADRYEKFAHGALAIMRKSGIIDEDTYNALSAKPYMAMMRESEPYLLEKTDESLLSVSHVPGTIQKLLHKAEGGRRRIVDPTIALMNFVDRAIVNSRKNEAMRLLVDQAIPKGRIGMYDGKARNLDKLAVRVKEPTDTSVTVFRNGKAEHWNVPPDVHKALKDVGLANTNSFYRAARKIGQLQKWWITHGATFMLRQLLRDPFTRNFASTVDSGIFDAIPLLGRITESEDAFGNKLTLRDRVRTYSDAELAAARRAGIEQFGHHMTTKRSYAQAIADELAKMGADAGGAKFSLLNPVEVGKLAKGKLDDLARWSELTNRMAEFRAVFKDQVEKGVDPQDAAREAAFQARDLMDFAVAGSWAKNVNDFVLFFNAAIRGTAKTVQTFKRDPRKAATKLLLYMLPLEAAAYALNAAQGEEAIQEYNEFPDYRKDLFYMIRTGPSNWLVVPKPYELALASSAMRRAYQDAHGEPHAWEGFLGSALQTLSPIGVQETVMPFAGLQPFAQAATNRDFFRDRYIIPPHEEGLRMEKRDTSRASRLSKGVSDVFGKVGVELDPRMSDHVLRGLFSQYGDWALELSNLGRTDRPRTFGDRVRTLTGSTASTPGPVSESMQALMKRAEREGETNVAKMRNFTRLRDRYYQTATPEEREKAGRQMENLARRYLEIYERRGTLKTIE